MSYSGLWTVVLGLGVMAFNATFNNISVISCRSANYSHLSKVFENFTLQITKIGHELTSGYFCVWNIWNIGSFRIRLTNHSQLITLWLHSSHIWSRFAYPPLTADHALIVLAYRSVISCDSIWPIQWFRRVYEVELVVSEGLCIGVSGSWG
jgi:hypothetical protein